MGLFGTGAISFPPALPELSFGADVDAIEADFVAAEGAEALGAIDDGFEGESGAGYRVIGGELGIGGLGADGIGQAGVLHFPDTLLAPSGYSHGLDQLELGLGLREVLGDQKGELGEETIIVFPFQDDGHREEAVAYGVAGADAFAFGGGGPRDFFPLVREALICFSDLMLVSPA